MKELESIIAQTNSDNYRVVIAEIRANLESIGKNTNDAKVQEMMQVLVGTIDGWIDVLHIEC